MTEQEAKEVLEVNELDLRECGLDMLPCKQILIESFPICYLGESKSNTLDAEIIGLIRKNDIQNIPFCSSYFTRFHNRYWYRNVFFEALQVIEALKVLKSPPRRDPNDTVTIDRYL